MTDQMTRLQDMAQVIRSKNAGPFEITFDIIFSNRDDYARVYESGVLGRERLADLYQVSEADLTCCMFFEPALAFKFTIIRRGDQGGIGERDTFGAQQHAPLLGLAIPRQQER